MVTMVHLSHFRERAILVAVGLIWPLSALVADDVTFAIAHITTQVIPLIGGSVTIIILVRTDNMSARER